jgi:hypothetical protein
VLTGHPAPVAQARHPWLRPFGLSLLSPVLGGIQGVRDMTTTLRGNYVQVAGVPFVDPRLKGDKVLWRYMDTAKFFDFIYSNKLHFTRGDQFEDKFEGAFTEALKARISNAYMKNGINFTFDEFKKKLHERVFLNCWHASIDDSMAMWSIYGKSTSAVAITTTVDKLAQAIKNQNLSHHVYIKKVKYIKHWRNPKLSISPYSNIFSYKVKAFEFEKEVRVIIDRLEEDFENEIREKDIKVQVSQSDLLRSIVVSPESPDWFYHLVVGVAKKFGVTAPIHRSKLAFPP